MCAVTQSPPPKQDPFASLRRVGRQEGGPEPEQWSQRNDRGGAVSRSGHSLVTGVDVCVSQTGAVFTGGCQTGSLGSKLGKEL